MKTSYTLSDVIVLQVLEKQQLAASEVWSFVEKAWPGLMAQPSVYEVIYRLINHGFIGKSKGHPAIFSTTFQGVMFLDKVKGVLS